MFDLHSHVLPGIDDGAPTLAAARALLADSEAQGVTHMVLTPHITPGAFDNTAGGIAERFKAVVNELQADCTVQLAWAAEVRLHADLPFALQAGTLPCFVGTQGQRSLLLELPARELPPVAEVIFEWLLSEGVQPILAHPERNLPLQQQPGRLVSWCAQGVALQLTAGSLLGDFGSGAQQLAQALLSDDCATLVASDCHNLEYRPSRMAAAQRWVASHFGDDRAQRLFSDAPRELSGGMFL